MPPIERRTAPDGGPRYAVTMKVGPLRTIKVKRSDGEAVLINERDFDPEIHKKVVERAKDTAAAETAKTPSQKPQLPSKAALSKLDRESLLEVAKEQGIAVDSNAAASDLLTVLLEARDDRS